METIKFRGNRVGIEKFKKTRNKDHSFYVEPTTEEFFGTVKFLGPNVSSELTVGSKVFFGTQHQTVRMAGTEICVMDESNVLAVLDEDDSQKTI